MSTNSGHRSTDLRLCDVSCKRASWARSMPEQKQSFGQSLHHTGELLFHDQQHDERDQDRAGALTVEREKFLLTDLFDELKALYDYPLGKEVSLEWDYPTDLPSLHSDRDKLKHIIQNLINNAFKVYRRRDRCCRSPAAFGYGRRRNFGNGHRHRNFDGRIAVDIRSFPASRQLPDPRSRRSRSRLAHR